MANQEINVGFAVKRAVAGNACLVVFFNYTRYPVYQATCESDVLCGIDSMLCQFVLADGLMSVGESLRVPCWVYQVLKYIQWHPSGRTR